MISLVCLYYIISIKESVIFDSPVFKLYKSGVLDDTACSISLNHSVLAVGYTADYFIIMNSWGKNGYIKIAYSKTGAGICGINSCPQYPTI